MIRCSALSTRIRPFLSLTLIAALSATSTPPAFAQSVVVSLTTSVNFSEQFNQLRGIGLLISLLSTQQRAPNKGMPSTPPVPDSVRPERPATNSEREMAVAELQLDMPAQVTLERREQVFFSAIPVDRVGNAIHGVTAEWQSSDPSVVRVTSQGQASASKEGTAQLTATAGSAKESVVVTVVAQTIYPSEHESASSRVRIRETRTRATLRAHRKSLNAHSVAPLMQAPPPEFGDDEVSSLYQPANAVGAPPGKTTPGAPVRAAATGGSEMPGSSSFNFSLPVVGLPGRGLDTTLSLVYNSRLWNKSRPAGGTRIYYNIGKSWLAPGFQIGFGQLREQSGLLTLIDPDGTRHEMANNPAGSETYDSTDGTFIHLDRSAGDILTYPDGTRATFGADGFISGFPTVTVKQPINITDRHGNFILISYLPGSYGTGVGPRRISTIQDTLGRYVRFYYDASKSLVAITVPGLSGQADLPVMRFYYQDITVNQSGLFQSGVTVTAPTTARVIKYIYLASATESGNAHIGYRFDYSAYGMIYQQAQLRGMTISTSPTDYTQTGTVTNEGTQAALTTYNYPTTPVSLADAPTYTQRTDDWVGRVSAQPVHYFSVNQGAGLSTVTAPDGTISETYTTVNPNQWDDGLVSRTIIKNSTTTFSDTVYTWQQGYNSTNPRLSQVQTTNEAAQTRAVVYSYDANSIYSNVSAVSERDFAAAGTLGTELRRTERTYLNQGPYWDRGLVHLPSSVKVYGRISGTMTLTSQTDLFYDETTPTAYADIGGMMYSDPGTNVRGNLTKTRAYPDVSNLTSYIDRTAAYDVAGNVLTAQVACCQQKAFTYSSTYNHAYSTSVTSGAGPTLTESASYDFNTGLAASATDANNRVTSYFYNASSLRPEHVAYPDGGATYYQYNDALFTDAAGRQHFFVKTSVRLDASRVADSYSYLDGRGAVTQTFTGYTAANGWSTQDIEYDAMGRGYRSSNPYYSDGYGAAGINPDGFWTTSSFDNLGRVTQVTMPRGDNNNTLTTSAQVSYAGIYITGTDQAGKVRRQKTDAMGRLVRLDEPTSSGLGTTTSPNQATNYDYDAQDNLVHIDQGSQDRYFKYDSLGRMIRELQVEQTPNSNYSLSDSLTGNNSWTRKIEYNSSDLVTNAYDARGVQTSFFYDGLNRVTQISYSDSTPTAHYYYDAQALPPGAPVYTHGYATGRLLAMTYGSGATGNYFGYDAMGRVVTQKQVTGSTTYSLGYAYNLGGLLTSETYPSGRVMTSAYDAAGRLSSVSDAATTFATSFAYAAHGGLTSETFGNTAIHAHAYNRRLQLSQAKLNIGSTVLQQFDYGYGEFNISTGAVDTSKNSGQIGKVSGTIGTTTQWNQGFRYDELNRLSSITEHLGSTMTTMTYSQSYTYDRYSNRFQSANSTLGLPAVLSSEVVAATNRFIATGSTPTTYDSAGNITQDTKFRGLTYAYDANGRQTSAANGTWTETQVYDCAGQRVRTTVGATTRTMVYDIFGQDVADYSGTSGSTLERENIYRGGQLLATYEASTTAIKYVLTDAQGSTRALMNNSGSSSTVIARHDYLPFGEEVSAGIGLRTSVQGYGATDTNRQKYGLAERDDTTGLDHTWFRKYENKSGRWTSPDPYLGSMRIAGPQSFNRYTYTQNDPVNFLDPSGLETCHQDPVTGEMICIQDIDGGTVTIPIPNTTLDDLPGAAGPRNGIMMLGPQSLASQRSQGPRRLVGPDYSQQKQFNDCITPAVKKYWRGFGRKAGKTIVGAMGAAVGIAAFAGAPEVGFGVRAAMATLGRGVTGTSLFHALSQVADGGTIGIVPALSGAYMVEGLSEMIENRRVAERAIAECAKRFPNASHMALP